MLQYWNRLSSLQRSVICFIIIFGTLSAFYVIPTIYHDYRHLERSGTLSEQKLAEDGEIQPGAFRDPSGGTKTLARNNFDQFAKDAVRSVKLKAMQRKRNSTVKNVVVLIFIFLCYFCSMFCKAKLS